MEDYIKRLTEYGLQEREAKIYKALLEIGDSTVLPIAKRAEIQRTYVYGILESLEKKELVSHYEKNGRRRYVAEDPGIIDQILRERLSSFATVLPELRALYKNAPNKPRVQFFEGKAEVRLIYEHLVHVPWYDCIYSHPHVIAAWGDYSTELGRRIAVHNVKARELLVSDSCPPYKEFFKDGQQSIRYLPKDLGISIDFILYENTLALVSYDKDIHTVVIESPGIVKSFKALFDFMWSAASLKHE